LVSPVYYSIFLLGPGLTAGVAASWLVGGPLLTAVSMLGSGLAPTIWILLAWRFFAGAGSALSMTGDRIYLIDIASENERGRYIATNQRAPLVGASAGPAIGGLLAESYGFRAPFLVVAAGGPITAVYNWLRPSEPEAERKHKQMQMQKRNPL
jgi:MFS family permease